MYIIITLVLLWIIVFLLYKDISVKRLINRKIDEEFVINVKDKQKVGTSESDNGKQPKATWKSNNINYESCYNTSKRNGNATPRHGNYYCDQGVDGGEVIPSNDLYILDFTNYNVYTGKEIKGEKLKGTHTGPNGKKYILNDNGEITSETLTLNEAKQLCDFLKGKCVGFIMISPVKEEYNKRAIFISKISDGEDDPDTYSKDSSDSKDSKDSKKSTNTKIVSYIKKDINYIEKQLPVDNIDAISKKYNSLKMCNHKLNNQCIFRDYSYDEKKNICIPDDEKPPFNVSEYSNEQLVSWLEALYKRDIGKDKLKSEAANVLEYIERCKEEEGYEFLSKANINYDTKYKPSSKSGDIKGRYVRITTNNDRLDDAWLNFAELQVISNNKNIALNMPSYSSSSTSSPRKGNDGNSNPDVINGNYDNSSIFLSGNDGGPQFWEVDLGDASRTIDKIIVSTGFTTDSWGKGILSNWLLSIYDDNKNLIWARIYKDPPNPKLSIDILSTDNDMNNKRVKDYTINKFNNHFYRISDTEYHTKRGWDGKLGGCNHDCHQQICEGEKKKWIGNSNSYRCRDYKTGEREAEEAEKRRIEEERIRLANEKVRQEEERKRQAEIARQQAEIAERQRQAEIARQKAEEEERKRQAEIARIKMEETERKRKAEIARQQAEEAERKRLAEEAERIRQAQEAERRRVAEAERVRQAQEAERKRQAEEAERKRQAEEAERKKQAEIARQQAEEAEKKRKEGESSSLRLIPIFDRNSNTADTSEGRYIIWTSRAFTYPCYNISTSGYINGGSFGSIFDNDDTTGVDFESYGNPTMPYRIIIFLPPAIKKKYNGKLKMSLVAPWANCLPKTMTINTMDITSNEYNNFNFLQNLFAEQDIRYKYNNQYNLGQIGDQSQVSQNKITKEWFIDFNAPFNVIVFEITSHWGSQGRSGSNSVWITSINFEKQETINTSSSSLITQEQAEKLLGKGVKLKLLYKGTRDGFDSTVFHQKCDNKGPTLSVMRSNITNQIAGGYTKASWTSNAGYTPLPVGDAFLFSIKGSNVNKYELKQHHHGTWAMYNASNYGPTFGGGHDIYVPTNPKVNNVSTYPYSYNVLSNTELFGTYQFTINEIEVYKVERGSASTGSDDIFELIKKNGWLNINQKPKLLYKASIHGKSVNDAVSRVGNASNTLFIAKIKDGSFIGAYSPFQWFGSIGYMQSTEPFLFDSQNKYTTDESVWGPGGNYAIYRFNRSDDTMFGFGGGHDFFLRFSNFKLTNNAFTYLKNKKGPLGKPMQSYNDYFLSDLEIYEMSGGVAAVSKCNISNVRNGTVSESQPDFFSAFNSHTSDNCFELNGWRLASNSKTYGNEGLPAILPNMNNPPSRTTTPYDYPRTCGFLKTPPNAINSVYIQIGFPSPRIVNNFQWFGVGSARNAKDIIVWASNNDHYDNWDNLQSNSVNLGTFMINASADYNRGENMVLKTIGITPYKYIYFQVKSTWGGELKLDRILMNYKT